MIEADTANTPHTILLIHGYWMTPLCWQPWIERYLPIEKEWLLAKEVKTNGFQRRKTTEAGPQAAPPRAGPQAAPPRAAPPQAAPQAPPLRASG